MFLAQLYKNFDPRALIIKKAADDVLTALGIEDPILVIAVTRTEMIAKFTCPPKCC